MRRILFTFAASLALIAAASSLADTAPAGTNPYRHLRATRHLDGATHPSSDITSFSASSALAVGVNHPPKK